MLDDPSSAEPAGLHENSVAESRQAGSLHPSGAPIIHSTNEGFRTSPADEVFPAADGKLVLAPLDSNAASRRVVPECDVQSGWRAVSLRLALSSETVGVGKSFTIPVSRSSPPLPSRVARAKSAPRAPSHAFGVGSSRGYVTASRSDFCAFAPLARLPDRTVSSRAIFPPVPSAAFGVGNSGEKDAIAAVRGAEGGSRKAIPFRVVPERGQGTDNFSEKFSIVETKEVCNVLHEHVSRSKVANNSVHLSPKRRLGMTEALAMTGGRDALAGESAGDEIDSGSLSVNCSDVGVDGDAGETLPEDALSKLVDLTEPGVLESGKVEPVGEQAASIEESSDIHVSSETSSSARAVSRSVTSIAVKNRRSTESACECSSPSALHSSALRHRKRTASLMRPNRYGYFAAVNHCGQKTP